MKTSTEGRRELMSNAKVEAAAEWLREELEHTGLFCAHVFRAGAKAGHSEAAIRKAAEKLGVVTTESEGMKAYRLPKPVSPDASTE